MKVKDLVTALQKLDPSGDIEVVCAGNEAIHYIDRLPAYYDGAVQELIVDDKNCIIGGKLRRRGEKIKIMSYGLDWVLMDDPELPIECPPKEDDHSEHCKQDVAKWRAYARRIHKNLQKSQKDT